MYVLIIRRNLQLTCLKIYFLFCKFKFNLVIFPIQAVNVYKACIEKLGFKVIPDGKEDRHDIIQAVEFHDPEKLIAFCEGIQKASPIDSHVTPIPWDMPGYDSQVIMAAGTFVSGASIELSADGPMKEPYAVYFQGGLTYPHAKYGIIMSLQRMAEKG